MSTSVQDLRAAARFRRGLVAVLLGLWTTSAQAGPDVDWRDGWPVAVSIAPDGIVIARCGTITRRSSTCVIERRDSTGAVEWQKEVAVPAQVRPLAGQFDAGRNTLRPVTEVPDGDLAMPTEPSRRLFEHGEQLGLWLWGGDDVALVTLDPQTGQFTTRLFSPPPGYEPLTVLSSPDNAAHCLIFFSLDLRGLKVLRIGSDEPSEYLDLPLPHALDEDSALQTLAFDNAGRLYGLETSTDLRASRIRSWDGTTPGPEIPLSGAGGRLRSAAMIVDATDRLWLFLRVAPRREEGRATVWVHGVITPGQALGPFARLALPNFPRWEDGELWGSAFAQDGSLVVAFRAGNHDSVGGGLFGAVKGLEGYEAEGEAIVRFDSHGTVLWATDVPHETEELVRTGLAQAGVRIAVVGEEVWVMQTGVSPKRGVTRTLLFAPTGEVLMREDVHALDPDQTFLADASLLLPSGIAALALAEPKETPRGPLPGALTFIAPAAGPRRAPSEEVPAAEVPGEEVPGEEVQGEGPGEVGPKEEGPRPPGAAPVPHDEQHDTDVGVSVVLGGTQAQPFAQVGVQVWRNHGPHLAFQGVAGLGTTLEELRSMVLHAGLGVTYTLGTRPEDLMFGVDLGARRWITPTREVVSVVPTARFGVQFLRDSRGRGFVEARVGLDVPIPETPGTPRTLGTFALGFGIAL